MIITKSARDRLLALLPQVLGLAMGCESLQLKLQGKSCLNCGWNLLREDENFRSLIAKMKGISQLSPEHVQIQLPKGI